MKEIKLKSQPRWMVRMFILVGAILGGVFAFISHPIGGTKANNASGTSDFMHYETVDGIGTISVCDPASNGEICITMMDKNPGATADDINNNDSYGYHYQRGNNYGFDPIAKPQITNQRVNASAFGPGNYYYSNIFIIWSYDRSSVRNDNLRGGSGDNESNSRGYPVLNPTDRRGPCPENYHVPSVGEISKLVEYWGLNYVGNGNELTLNYTSGGLVSFQDETARTQFSEEFRLPFAGTHDGDGDPINFGALGVYWTSSPDLSKVFWLFISSNGVSANSSTDYRADGYSLRCFKDEYLSYPLCSQGQHTEDGETCIDNTKTVTCLTGNATGVAYNVQEVTITYDTGTETWESIPNCEILGCADGYHLKPAGILSETMENGYSITHYDNNISYLLNVTEDSSGELFTGVGTIAISNGEITISMLDRNLGAKQAGTGCEDPELLNVCANGIEDETYGYHFQWGNNYGFKPCFDNNGCSTFSNGIGINGQVDTNIVSPGYTSGIYYYGYYNWINSNDNVDLRGGGEDYNYGDSSSENFLGYGINNTGRQGPCPEGRHVPSAGEINKVFEILGGYSTSAVATIHNEALIPFAGYRELYSTDVNYLGMAAILRTSSPHSTWHPGAHVFMFSADDMSVNWDTVVRSYGFSVRCFYNFYELNTKSPSCELNEKVGLCLENGAPGVHASYDVLNTIWTWNSGTNSWDIPSCNWSCDEHYHTGVNGNTCDIDTFTITFVDSSGENADIVWTGEYSSETSGNVDFPSWTRNGYTLSWSREIPNVVPAENIVIAAIWTKMQSGGNGGGGGGGSSLKKDNCPDGDYSDSYYDGTCGEKPIQNDDEKDTLTKPQNDKTGHNSADEIVYDTLKFNPYYSDEMNMAYQYAYHYGITTKNNIRDAAVNQQLTRIAMAKMLSQYAINVLGIKPDATRNNEFADVSDKLDTEYGDGVTLAYQLGIMGINMPNNKFRPYGYVTRAEFATALSRLLYNTSDGEFEKTSKYYVPHINKLAYEGILTNTDPYMKELRGYVMLMLMRTAK